MEGQTDPNLRQLLDEMEQIWRAVDPTLPDDLAPGLSPQELDEITAPLGLRLNRDAKTWYGWHNGTHTGHGRGCGATIGAYSASFIDAEIAAGEYRSNLAIAEHFADVFGSMGDAGWDPAWFPLCVTIGGTVINTDCSVTPPNPAPIRVRKKQFDQARRIIAPSLTTVVQQWLDLYRLGYYYWNADLQRWAFDDDSQSTPPPWLVDARAAGIA
jgi:cell wall assembly regulator SMI1